MRLIEFQILALVLLVSLLHGFGMARETEDPGISDGHYLTVAEIGVGSGYERATRELEGESTVFPAGTIQLWCRTRITGAETPTSITHVWYHDDRTVARVDLHVGSPDWRTVSSKKLLPDWTGPWEVKVLDETGTVLGSIRFTVQ